MILVNIIGGLGNQMFQYAFGYAISKENNIKIKLDIRGYNSYHLRNYELGLYNIEEGSKLKFKYDFLFNKLNGNTSHLNKVTRKVLQTFLRRTKFYYQEREEFIFDKEVFDIKTNTYFYGYWQNEKYFKKYRKELIKIFTLKSIHSKTTEYQQKIIDCEAVSIHIRRGDYVTNANISSVHGVCDINYYKKAVKEVLKNKKQIQFFIFSDDMVWAKDNLNFINNKIFVELDSNIPDHEEMYLMSKCKHNIIANSSFSWWGAWLNQYSDKKVIAPKKWLNNSKLNANDLIPASWIRL
jgi:hypothetical protein